MQSIPGMSDIQRSVLVLESLNGLDDIIEYKQIAQYVKVQVSKHTVVGSVSEALV